ncbi:phosphoenolpyruvate carboxylase [Geminicoccus roseus]|uniref:phosphoenolpyruvate carboxylase n=1 Tax=Geminicoccus roseus TaxID=404900 RepID=UPI000414E863|nr:phosphoenolpyruvate carboxylase [Geminicoccus roseus]
MLDIDGDRKLSAALEQEPDALDKPAAALRTAHDSLAGHRTRVDTDPFTSPIRLMALDLKRAMDRGEIDMPTLDAMIGRLSSEAFVGRAERLSAYLGEVGLEANSATVERLIRDMAEGPAGVLPAAEFGTKVGRVLYGFVFTAHPTFSLSNKLQQAIVGLALTRDEAERRAIMAEVERLPHAPEPQLDLAEEFRQSVAAIAQVRAALMRVYAIVLKVAEELYPDQWRGITPKLASVASWVGYDMDGRSDIPWTATLAHRLMIQEKQLAAWHEEIRTIAQSVDGDDTLAASLELVEARIVLSAEASRSLIDLLQAARPDQDEWWERLARVSRRSLGKGAGRITGGKELASLVQRVLDRVEDGELARRLWLLHADMAAHGLGLARTHMRINAIQLHNAIRKTIGMEHAPDDPSYRQSYVEAAAKLIEEVKPVSVHLGTINGEKATAKRIFMLVEQMLELVDRDEPIRFLIAECETSFTLLAALYFAKLFGVEDRIDISPLFETRTALVRGVEIVAGALEVPVYRDYIKKRGRLCVQTGFSDAGRFLGQTAACYLIEKIRLSLAPLLEKHGLTGVELVIFDTHGESIGRGAHPGSFRDRFAYYDTAESRRRFRDAGLVVREETSYQGSDGYQYFLTETTAFAVVTRVLEHCLAPIDDTPDPFYAERVYVGEFFTSIEQFNEEVIQNRDYAALLGAWGTNMLWQTGSRPAKRQYDGATGRMSLDHPSQLRAIPHNAILQQLGMLANTIGGVGRAIDKDPETFHRLYAESPRFRRMLGMVEHAFKWTDLEVVKAYIDLYDPGTWLARAQSHDDDARIEELREVAGVFERMRLHERLVRIHRVFLRDYMDLARALKEHRRRTRDAGATPIVVDREARDNIHLLHALRLALMQKLDVLAIHVPDFSDRHSTSRSGIVARLTQLDVEPAIDILREVFPMTEPQMRAHDFGVEATYRSEESQSYGQEHALIFEPILRLYGQIRRIGSAVVHHLSAVG